MSQNNEVARDCFLQNIMISNGRWEGQAEEAGRKVVEALAVAEPASGSDKLVTCERCETTFRVAPAGNIAGVMLVTDKECDQSLGIQGWEAPRWQLNIFLGRLPRQAEQA